VSNLLRRLAGLVAAGGLALLLAPPLSAQGAAAAAPPLRSALDAAWQRAAAARATALLRAQAEVERAAAEAAGPAPPALALGLRSDRLHRDRGAREAEVGVALPLWPAGERSARVAAAAATLAHADAAVAVARLELAGTLREAAWAVALRRAELAAAADQLAALTRLADDVDRRVRAGESAPADALAAHAERLGAQAQQAEAAQRLHEAAAQWQALTGQADPPVALAVEGKPDAGGPDAGGPDAAGHGAGGSGAGGPDDAAAGRPTHPGAGPAPPQPAAHPQAQLARQAVEAARQRLRLAQATPRAAPELSLGLRRSEPGFGQRPEDSVVVGLRLPLAAAPVHPRRVAAAQAELDHAEAVERELHARLAAALAVARQALAAAHAQRDAEAARARLLHERAALVGRAWRAGEAALPELLRALAVAAQADAALARQQAGLGLAAARLQQALGVEP
jgi:outer membrane protein TolC